MTAPPGATWRWLALLALAGALCYANSLQGPFLFDDASLALESPFSLRNRPLVRASLALNREISATHTRSYHLVNVAVHVAAAWVLFGLVRRTLPRVTEAAAQRAEPFAFAVALVWLVHPLQTESVSYISQRAESLAGLFLLSTLYAFVRAQASARPRVWQAAALGALVLGMATKEIAATAPALLLCYDALFLSGSRRAAGSLRAALAQRGRFHALYAAATLALGAWFIGPLLFGAETSGFGVETVSAADYARTQPGVILHYLALAFVPVGQCLDSMWPLARGLGEWLPQALVLAALAAATLWALWRRSWLGFAGAWFFVTLAPTSSFVPIQDPAVEHRMYLPLAAVVVVVLGGLWALCTRLAPGRKGAPLALALVLATVLGALTVRRNVLYRDAEAMWSDVVAKAPHNWRAHLSLGTVQLAQGEHAEAAASFERSLALSPRPNTWLELGRAHSRRGAHAEALRAFDEADRMRPLHAETLLDRGIAYLRAGDPRALVDLERSAALAPSGAAFFNLGVAALNSGDGVRAERHFRRARELLPESPQAQGGLGRALFVQGRLAEARVELEHALRLAPGDRELAELLARCSAHSPGR
jgi:tetratricopeptide (TPR) repeat protein